jgi:hypothetical protein
MKQFLETSACVNRARAIGALLLVAFASAAAANDFSFSPTGVFPNFVWNVSIDGGVATHNPPVTLIRGRTYNFIVTGLAPVHSFYIKTVSSTGSLNAYSGGGLSANGIAADTPPGTPITFTVPQTAPDTLFYNCGVHSTMAGTITIDGIFANDFE